METVRELDDANAALYVLAYLTKSASFLSDSKYNLVKEDFFKTLPRMIFNCMVSLRINSGAANFSSADICGFMQANGMKERFEQYKGLEYCLNCEKLSDTLDPSNFDFYYNRLKKFSLLRELSNRGYNTDKIYNPTNILRREEEDQRLNNTPINKILEVCEKDFADIRAQYLSKANQTCQSAGDGIFELLDELNTSPEIGPNLDGDILNSAVRGARPGKMYIYSSTTSGGKTRFLVDNCCNLSLPYFDNSGNLVFRGTPEEPLFQKTLFITTEQKADEIQTMILAHIANVNESYIVENNGGVFERERIKQAARIIKEYGNNLIIESIPDPSVEGIKAIITKHIVQDNVEAVFYDYLFTSPSLLAQFAQSGIREDVALMMFSNTLKEIAAEYSIFMVSCTQVNEKATSEEIGERDQTCVRGSKAIMDKADVGLCAVKPSDAEWEKVAAYWGELQKKDPIKYNRKPNICVDLYKNRRGQHTHIKIWRYFDLGTCRAYDMFATTTTYELYELNNYFVNSEARVVGYLELKLENMK